MINDYLHIGSTYYGGVGSGEWYGGVRSGMEEVRSGMGE